MHLIGWWLAGALALGACGSGNSVRGPSWPKPSERAADGGESLAPRTATVALEAGGRDDHDDDEPSASRAIADDDDKAPAAPSNGVTPAPSTPTPDPPADESIQLEEIVIDVDD